jgi:hypothetical protein
MTTYVRIETGSELLRRARVEVEAKRLAFQEQQEIDEAIKKATPETKVIPDELLPAPKQQEAAALYQPQLVEGLTYVTVNGSYAEQTLNLSLKMETFLNKSKLLGDTVIATKGTKIYETTSDLVGAGAALGFGYSYDNLSCEYRGTGSSGAYIPTAGTPGQWLEYGAPQATPTGTQDLYNIRIQHNWLDVIVYDERRQGDDLGIYNTFNEILLLEPQPGDIAFSLEESKRGYFIYDPFPYPVFEDREGYNDWYAYNDLPELRPYVLVGPKTPMPSSILGSSFYGQVEWRLIVIVLYEVVDNAASKLRYISPIPLTIACLATESRSHKINIVYPDDFVAGFKDFGSTEFADAPATRNAVTYAVTVFGRQNAGEQWGRAYAENIARSFYQDTVIDEGSLPSNIYFSAFSVIIGGYKVTTWKNTPFDPGGTPAPENQPSQVTGFYNAVIRDPRN